MPRTRFRPFTAFARKWLSIHDMSPGVDTPPDWPLITTHSYTIPHSTRSARVPSPIRSNERSIHVVLLACLYHARRETNHTMH